MRVTPTPIADVKLITPVKHLDDRGFFLEVYNFERMLEHGLGEVFVQDNVSFSRQKGTVRGLHYQLAPFAQAKLVQVLRGAIYDVAVDIREGSPTYGQHVGVTLTADDFTQIFVPVGFAHGFCTIEPETLVAYKVTHVYSREHDRGLAWDDPDLGIAWPISPHEAVLSEKDRLNPRLLRRPS
jgi:dTDP-4-dehydrorhamnose 3,5-epimerase